jgi:NUMOD3 motif
LVEYYGRKDKKLGPLINHTDGGDGSTGLRVTEENKEKARRLMTGNSYCSGKEPWNKGMDMPKTTRKPRSQEAKDKIRESLKRKGIKPPNQSGYKHTEEVKLKISNASRLRGV